MLMIMVLAQGVGLLFKNPGAPFKGTRAPRVFGRCVKVIGVVETGFFLRLWMGVNLVVCRFLFYIT